jgi:hypothetical protein
VAQLAGGRLTLEVGNPGQTRVALDENEGAVKAQFARAVFFAPLVARGARTKNFGNLTVNHFSVKPIVSPTIDTV